MNNEELICCPRVAFPLLKLSVILIIREKACAAWTDAGWGFLLTQSVCHVLLILRSLAQQRKNNNFIPLMMQISLLFISRNSLMDYFLTYEKLGLSEPCRVDFEHNERYHFKRGAELLGVLEAPRTAGEWQQVKCTVHGQECRLLKQSDF